MGLMKRILANQQYNKMMRNKRNKQGGTNFAPEVNITYMSETMAYMRRKNTEELEKFNANMLTWGRKVANELKAAAPVKHGVLRDSIKVVRKLKEGETKTIGFNMARHGAYIFQGAGRGYGGQGLSKWYNPEGKRVTANPLSIGRLGLRGSIDWFNPVIRRNQPELIELVQDYASELIIDVSRIYMI